MINAADKLTYFSNILKAFKISFEHIIISERNFFDIYDISLSLGFKYSKLDKILPDIGLALNAYNIPTGHLLLKEGVYRIEVQKSEIISQTFSEIYKSGVIQNNDLYSPIILGSDFNGAPLIIDLQQLPNLLLGGIPGSGKSILLHSMILSLAAKPSNLFLIDPKQVEFGVYSSLKSVKNISNSLQESLDAIHEVINIMEERFSLLASYRFRNIIEYNQKSPPQKNLTPVVIIIDEWADLFLQEPEIQKPLCLVAQKGRAAGVSVILATQRPSANIISGSIKANFSGRIALRVASNVDSRVILDQGGAENLKNIAEGLYFNQNLSRPMIFKTAFIEDPKSIISQITDIKSRIPFWKKLWQ